MLYIYVYHVFKTNGSKVSKDFFLESIILNTSFNKHIWVFNS